MWRKNGRNKKYYSSSKHHESIRATLQYADDRLYYEIYSEPKPATGTEVEPIVHSQGMAESGSVGDSPVLDLSGLQAACNQHSLSAEQCYTLFSRMGIEYGPSHRGIEALYAGRDQVLAKLSLPPSVADTKEQYVLHPSIMDTALQTTIGLMLKATDTIAGDNAVPKPMVPFALSELEILDRSPSSAWAWIRYSNGHSAGNKRLGNMARFYPSRMFIP